MEALIGLFMSQAVQSVLPAATAGAGGFAALALLARAFGFDLAQIRKAVAGFALPMAGLLATHWMQNGFGNWPDWSTMLQYSIVALATSGGVFAFPNKPVK
jgi:hypothetical protein